MCACRKSRVSPVINTQIVPSEGNRYHERIEITLLYMDPIQDIRYTPPSQQPMRPTPPPPPPKKSHHGLLWSLLILVILVLVGYWLLTMNKDMLTDGAGNPITVADEGEVVGNFPNELLIEPSAMISDSYAIYYRDRGETMPYVEYTSDETFEDNIIAFRAILTADDWIITKEADPVADVSNIYAIRGDNETVNVTFSRVADGKTKVQISYTETQ